MDVMTLGMARSYSDSQIALFLTSGATPKGAWDASTNTPTLADGAGNLGWYYDVVVAGTSLGQTFLVGDRVMYNASSKWQRVPTGVESETPMVIIFIDESSTLPTTRLSGNPLKVGDYCQVKSTATLPFDIGGIHIDNYGDIVEWNGSSWQLRDFAVGKTDEVKVSSKADESLGGAAEKQADINKENKAAILARVEYATAMPSPSASCAGRVVKFVGASTGIFVYGHNYICEAGEGGAYAWSDIVVLSGDKGIEIFEDKIGHENEVEAQTTKKLSKLSFDAQGHITGASEISADRGLDITSDKIGHANSVTAQATAKIGKVAFDAQGHITDFSETPLVTSLSATPSDENIMSEKLTIDEIKKAQKGFKFTGYVADTLPTDAKAGELGYMSSSQEMPTVFPLQVHTFDGASWSATVSEYTPAALDLWANKNSNHGYYWFGNAWNLLDFNAGVDDTTIGYNSSNLLSVKDAGIATAKIADEAVTKAKIAEAAKVVYEEDSQTLKNKTIDADDNSISDLTGDNFKAQTAADKGKAWVVQDDGTWDLGKAGGGTKTATCSTEITSAAKAVTVSDYDSSLQLLVTFANGSTATSPLTLNVNGGGDYPLMYRGRQVGGRGLAQGEVDLIEWDSANSQWNILAVIFMPTSVSFLTKSATVENQGDVSLMGWKSVAGESFNVTITDSAAIAGVSKISVDGGTAMNIYDGSLSSWTFPANATAATFYAAGLSSLSLVLVNFSTKLSDASDGLKVENGTVKHTNSVTVQETQNVQAITYDAQGHITAGEARPIVASWSATTANTNIPGEKLTKDTLDGKPDMVKTSLSGQTRAAIMATVDEGKTKIYTRLSFTAEESPDGTTTSVWCVTTTNQASAKCIFEAVSTDRVAYACSYVSGTWSDWTQAGKGIEVESDLKFDANEKLTHTNAVSANANDTLKSFQYDAQGHVTAATEKTLGRGLRDASNEIGHSNDAIGAQTTQNVMAIKHDVYGHITGSDARPIVTAWSATTADTNIPSEKLTKDTLDGKLDLSGGTMLGPIAMGGNPITGLATPTTDNGAVNKSYVDSNFQAKITYGTEDPSGGNDGDVYIKYTA